MHDAAIAKASTVADKNEFNNFAERMNAKMDTLTTAVETLTAALAKDRDLRVNHVPVSTGMISDSDTVLSISIGLLIGSIIGGFVLFALIDAMLTRTRTQAESRTRAAR